MFTALVLLVLGATFLTLSSMARHRASGVIGRRLRTGCLVSGLLVLAAVVVTPTGGEATLTPLISAAWFVASCCLIVAVILLASAWIEVLHRQAFNRG